MGKIFFMAKGLEWFFFWDGGEGVENSMTTPFIMPVWAGTSHNAAYILLQFELHSSLHSSARQRWIQGYALFVASCLQIRRLCGRVNTAPNCPHSRLSGSGI